MAPACSICGQVCANLQLGRGRVVELHSAALPLWRNRDCHLSEVPQHPIDCMSIAGPAAFISAMVTTTYKPAPVVRSS